MHGTHGEPQRLWLQTYQRKDATIWGGFYQSEPVFNATKIICTILGTKNENKDLNKTIARHCQHLIVTEQDELITLLNKYKFLFDGSLGTWDTNLVDFELKEVAKPVCSRTHSVPKSQ